MNFIFISPNFPENYWQFCSELQMNGVNVLGIGDCPYTELDPHVRDSLNEYYKVGSLENYGEVYRAVAFFAFKYGKIDWLESNNEYWLEQDARLRTDFNITSGFKNKDMDRVKYKSRMKEYYTKAGIPVARYHLVDNPENSKAFIEKVGYPVIVKPDNGVGANDTYKLESDEDLEKFFESKPPVQYIMEEFVNGQICSYDAIINSKGEPLFESGNQTPISVMDIVNNQDDCFFYIEKDVAEDVRAAGRRCVESFGVKSRFVHMEFFRLLKDQEGLGKEGDVVALEVNMRPSGGFSPDMLNFANSVNVYKIWADMIVFDRRTEPADAKHYFCPYVGRRDYRSYSHSDEEVLEEFGAAVCMYQRMPDALSGAMGNQMFIGRFETKQGMEGFVKFLLD